MEFQKVTATHISVVGKLVPTDNFRKPIFLVILELLHEYRINEMHLLPLYPKREMGSEEQWNLPSSIVNKTRSFPKSKILAVWKTANQKIWVIRQNKIEQVQIYMYLGGILDAKLSLESTLWLCHSGSIAIFCHYSLSGIKQRLPADSPCFMTGWLATIQSYSGPPQKRHLWAEFETPTVTSHPSPISGARPTIMAICGILCSNDHDLWRFLLEISFYFQFLNCLHCKQSLTTMVIRLMTAGKNVMKSGRS